VIIPTPTTDAAPPERGCEGIVFLAGAIKYWWLKRCKRCGAILPEDAEVCTREYTSAQTGQRKICGWVHLRDLWGGPEHKEYVAYRDRARALLIDAGYLTYAPHEAFKGTWDERAQAVNDAGISAADLMVNLSPLFIPTEGTDAEIAYAKRVGTPAVRIPPQPSLPDDAFLLTVKQSIRNGIGTWTA